MRHGTSILDDGMIYLQNTLEKFGWPILITCLALYFAKPYIQSLLRRKALESANDPRRIQILKQDMKKVRLNQQLEYYRSTQ
jgi:hypothetical protein